MVHPQLANSQANNGTMGPWDHGIKSPWLSILDGPKTLIFGNSPVGWEYCWNTNTYPLVNEQFAIEHGHRNSGFTH